MSSFDVLSLANGLGALCGSYPPEGSFGSFRSSGYSSRSSSGSSSCTSCDGGATCSETLCDFSSSAQQQRRIRPAPFQPPFTVPPPTPPVNIASQGLPPRLLQSRALNLQYLSDADDGAQCVRERLDSTSRMMEAVELKSNQVVSDIRQVARRLVAAVEGRERELVARVERVRASKRKSLSQQADALGVLLARYMRLSDGLRDSMQRGSPVDQLHSKEKAAVELAQLRAASAASAASAVRGVALPHEDDYVLFSPPEPITFRMLSTMGSVSSSASALNTVASGEGLKRAIKGHPAAFTVQVKSHLDETVTSGAVAELLDVALVSSDGSVERIHVEDRRDGSFLATYTARVEGRHSVHVTLRGCHVAGSPFQVAVRPVRSAFLSRNTSPTMPVPYNAVRQISLAFGCEGDADGNFLRPWGICCDRRGRLIVADRSNNRVQIFSPDGTFKLKFGSHGNGAGQFDRPAGIATDKNGRIIVADKDNHRIQIFDEDGNFLRMFGEIGSRNGQFNYPWDVAANEAGQIVVSDTRNHRIQLFSPEGVFITKYGWENSTTMWRHFDTPRGVCFHPEGFVVVTDFNNHRLVVVEPSFRNARFLGSEGPGVKQFQRPQGIAVDAEGRIIVSDSRNNRLQIFEANGTFVTQIGAPSINLDRPSGVCVTPDGMIAVIDFGNNRVTLL